MKEYTVTRVTPRGVSDGDPGALSAVCARRGPAVLAYCELVCPGQAQGAAADAFSAFRAGVVQASDPLTLDPDALLLHATRRAAAARAPDPEPTRGGLRRRLSTRRAASPCEMVPELLVARAHGALSPADEDRLTEHLRDCPSCREAAERFKSAERVYRNPPSSPLAPAVTEALVEALLSAAPVSPGTLRRTAHVKGTQTNGNGATVRDGASEALSAKAADPALAPLPADSRHHETPGDLTEPDHHERADRLAEPDHHGTADRLAEPDHHGTADRLAEPDHHGTADRLAEPDHHGTADRLAEPDHHGTADRLAEPDHEEALGDPVDPTTLDDLDDPEHPTTLEKPHCNTTLEEPDHAAECHYLCPDDDSGVDPPVEPVSSRDGGSLSEADQTVVVSPLSVERDASEPAPGPWAAGDDEEAGQSEPDAPSRVGVLGSWRLGRELPRSRRDDRTRETDHGLHGWAYRLGLPAIVVLGALAATLVVAGVFAGGAADHPGAASFVRPLSSSPPAPASASTDSASSGAPPPTRHRRHHRRHRAGAATPPVRPPVSAAVGSSPRHYRLAAHPVTVPSASPATPIPHPAPAAPQPAPAAPAPVTPAQVHKLKQGTSRAGPPGSAPPAASPGYQPGQ